jgi:hypothetical protein
MDLSNALCRGSRAFLDGGAFVESPADMIDRALTPRPRDVAGFAEAQAIGATPALPVHPPLLPLSEATAHALLRRLGYTLTATCGTALLTLLVLPRPKGRINSVTAIAIVVALVIGGLLSRRALAVFRSRLLEEMQAGYVTTTFQQGGFWLAHRNGRALSPGRNVLGWEWRGLWVLDSEGAVVSPPDRTFDPPGLYSSPHSPRERELWTGHQWTFVYPDRAG